eukprot:Gregarina_sp_Poly_1__10820@NODE_835_length_6073_cov_244_613387_g603_i0_p3_GENE_NODE_835_length_6073_cov_244_613387_g603_i0NODE_835_length_6073_cov_244_613387_g603_i0_p3_ORF_typecomplete_len317_score37_93_NODE_835_length_6073_cov_244_613387_g603_i041055055
MVALFAFFTFLLRYARSYSFKIIGYSCENDCCAGHSECDLFIGSWDACFAAVGPDCVLKTRKRFTLDRSDVVIGPGKEADPGPYIGFRGVNAGVYFKYRTFLKDWLNQLEFLTNITIFWELNDCFDKKGRMFYWPYDETKVTKPDISPPSMPQVPLWDYPVPYYTKSELLIPPQLAFQHQYWFTNGSMAVAYLLAMEPDPSFQDEFPAWDPQLDLNQQSRETLSTNRVKQLRETPYWNACDFAWTEKGPFGEFEVYEWVPKTANTAAPSTTAMTNPINNEIFPGGATSTDEIQQKSRSESLIAHSLFFCSLIYLCC